MSVVLFSAEWAEQCKQMLDVLSDLSKNPSYTTSLQFVNVPAEDLSEISLKYNIEAVPTVLFIKNGKKSDSINGVDIAALTVKCKKLVSGDGATEKADLNARLKALTHQAKVMIFMKGDRKAPRCGFSKTLIEIMNNTQAEYETFDILSDENVRQGLKTYSDWPTYPQVYVNGELIGGLDIIKEMLASNELITTLNG